MNERPRNDGPNFDDVEHLPLYYYDLTPRLMQQAKEELFEENDKTKIALCELRALIEDLNKSNNMELPIEDAELIPFLRARKHNVEKAFAMYKKYYSQFSRYDKLFRDVDFSSILKIFQSNVTGYLPKRDDDGCAVAIVFVQKWDPSICNSTNLLKAQMISLIDVIRCPITQVTGLKIIVDYSGFSFSQLITVRLWHMMYVAEFIQNSTPLRIKGVHILNHGHVFYLMWRFLKPMLSEKAINRMHFHGQDVGSLHRFFSPSILPEELGGNTGPYDTSEWLKIFAQSKNYIMTKINKFNTTSWRRVS